MQHTADRETLGNAMISIYFSHDARKVLLKERRFLYALQENKTFYIDA